MEVADNDKEMDTVDLLRLGGPNALEVADEAAAEIELLRKLLGESARREGAANARAARLLRDVEAEREACAQVLLNGSFLHDQSPAKLFAQEAAAAIRRRTR
jgi:hypothetical protein